ncbi:hypothetical protein CDL60_01485 [Roseateles noduli]|nr:hypothetical protein CDL60_01485 [Roseateles noduli]
MAFNSSVARLIAASSLVLVVGTAAAAPQAPAPDAYTELAAERFREIKAELKSDAAIVVKGPLTIQLGDSFVVSLDRIYAFCQSNASHCARETDRYARRVFEVWRDREAPAVKEKVRLVVRSEDYLAQAEKAAGDKPESRLMPRPLVDGLVIVPALDTPSSLRMLGRKDATSLQLDADALFALALSNTLAGLKPITEAPVAVKGSFGRLVGDVYEPSRLASPEAFAPLVKAHNGTLLVMAPLTDVLLYVGEDTPTAREAMRLFGRNLMKRSPNPLSDIVLRWTDKGWQRVD